MAVIETTKRSAISVKLDAGTNPNTGAAIVRSCSLGSIVENADAQKVMNVVNLLGPVLEYTPIRVERTKVTLLTNN